MKPFSIYQKMIKVTVIGIAFLFSAMVHAAGYMPFVLGKVVSGEDMGSVVAGAETALKENGFEVVGKYSPNTGAEVIVVTNKALKNLAAKSKNGGFGAMQRVSVVQKGAAIEVSYTNPVYMWNVYRMEGDITPIQTALKKAIGSQKEFGADEPISADDLRDYQYKMMMPYFDDQDELAGFDSYQEAIKSVEAGLKAGIAGSSKVYRIDIPGKDVTVFGVALKHQQGSDAFISQKIDKNSHSHAAHFPYELLVVDDEVIALNAKFRIAINWPHLSMMGEGSFMSISSAPNDINDALEAVAKNKQMKAIEPHFE